MDVVTGSFTGLVVAVLASAAIGFPFMRTTAAHRVLRPFGGGQGGDDPYAAAAVYAGLSVTYAAIVVILGESATGSGAFGLTLTLLLPFGFGLAAATAWLPSVGVEWRPPGEARTNVTLTFTALLATLTATSAGGWLLLG